MKIKNNNQGFTLLELLVVVLIIGILAAIALPQYQRAKEKSIMSEGLQLVKQIAEANQRYYLLHGEYADDIRNLDIEFSGTSVSYYDINRIQTNNFILSSLGVSGSLNHMIAVAQERSMSKYYMHIFSNNPNRIICGYYSAATKIQKELCDKLNTDGHL